MEETAAVGSGYNSAVEGFRDEEYPMLQGSVYLDHAGTTLHSKSLMDRFAADMTSNLLGNPHSGSSPSQYTTSRIEDVRLRLLRFFGTDPADFDLVFVANATAGVKVVVDALRGGGGFSYAYHRACHTSLVGMREEATRSVCLDDSQVRGWVAGRQDTPFAEDKPKQGGCSGSDDVLLFSYPAQSHMDGRRYPLSWASDVRKGPPREKERKEEEEEKTASPEKVYILLDAASLVATSPLRLADPETAPDFTVLSLYKIFGFPDLGALIVRRQAEPAFHSRRYFGGGTVDLVACGKEQWHAPRSRFLHERLEDGTLPFHSILALDAALDSHQRLFGSMASVSSHTSFLARRLYDGLDRLRHGNGQPVCTLYTQSCNSDDHDDDPQNLGVGSIIAFNLRNAAGAWTSLNEFEKLTSLKNFHVRTGGVCSPGGVAAALDLQPWELRRNFSAGFRCDADQDIIAGKPTGVIRASLGAMSTVSDVDSFVAFVDEFYREEAAPTLPSLFVSSSSSMETTSPLHTAAAAASDDLGLHVESLTVYPIKSCAGYQVPPHISWEIKPEGLAWDREWCLVHQGTGQALSQKRHPKMALLRPTLDFARGLLRVYYHHSPENAQAEDEERNNKEEEISIPLSAAAAEPPSRLLLPSRVCGDDISAQPYSDPTINEFFTTILGVPCLLARFPAGGQGRSMRHSKAQIQQHQKKSTTRPATASPRGTKTPQDQRQPPPSLNLQCSMPGSFPTPDLPSPPESDSEQREMSRILLANESPILLVNALSLEALNHDIRDRGDDPVPLSSFRANIVVGSTAKTTASLVYAEDSWTGLRIGAQGFSLMGSCRRCQMVCIDQNSGKRRQEPFVTLAKTRRFDGKVYFGVHMRHDPTSLVDTRETQYPTICVGDVVQVNESRLLSQY